MNRRDFLKLSTIGVASAMFPNIAIYGEQELTETLHIYDDFYLDGVIRSSGFPAVHLHPGASITGGTIETDDVGILVEGSGYYATEPTRISNINIKGNLNHPSGTGILLHTTQGQSIYGVMVDNVSVPFHDVGIDIYPEYEMGESLAVVNACSFSNINMSWCRIGVNIQVENTYTRANGHLFSNLQMQKKPNYTERMILCGGKYNQFTNVMPWDFGTDVAVEFTESSQRNDYRGLALPGQVLDNGWFNRII